MILCKIYLLCIVHHFLYFIFLNVSNLSSIGRCAFPLLVFNTLNQEQGSVSMTPPKKIKAKAKSHINRNSAVFHSSIYAKLGHSMIKFVFSDSACSNKHSISQFLFWIEESWDCIPILVHNIGHKWNWVSIFPMAYINILSNKSLHLEFPPHFLPEKVCTVQRKFTINFAYISVGLLRTSRFGSSSTQKYTDGL